MPTKKIDAHWSQALRALAVPHPIQFFDETVLDDQTQKNLFWNQKIRNPHLKRKKIIIHEITTYQKKIQNLQNTINHHEENPVIRDIYTNKTQELIDELSLVIASHNNDWETWQHLNETLYGALQDDLFWKSYAYIQQKIQLTTETIHTDKTTREKLLQPFTQNTSFSFLAPTDTLQTKLQQIIQPFLQKIETILPQQDTFNAQETITIVKKWLKLMKLEKEWHVTQNTLFLRVCRESRTISIPDQYQVNRRLLREVLAHEIGLGSSLGGHIVRSANGRQTKLEILAEGLSGYASGEEGICVLWEQLIEKGFLTERKIIFYLLLGFITGKHGDPMDFRSIYEWLYHYYQYKSAVHNDPKEIAYANTMRLFRGTDTTINGLAFMKDKIYLEGNQRIWELLEKNPESIHQFSVGSYDPTNQQHLDWLKTLNIL